MLNSTACSNTENRMLNGMRWMNGMLFGWKNAPRRHGYHFRCSAMFLSRGTPSVAACQEAQQEPEEHIPPALEPEQGLPALGMT